MEAKKQQVRKLNTRQAAFLQNMPKGASIEQRRSHVVGATVGEGPQRSDAGRGARVAK